MSSGDLRPWHGRGSDPEDPAAWRGPVPSPYRGTPFDVLGVPPEPIPRRDLLARVRRRIRRARAGRVSVDGAVVRESELRAAEDRLSRPGSWAAAHLLAPAHHPEPVAAADLRERLDGSGARAPRHRGGLLDRAVLAELLVGIRSDG